MSLSEALHRLDLSVVILKLGVLFTAMFVVCHLALRLAGSNGPDEGDE